MSKQSNFNPDENLVVFGNLLVHGTVTGKGNVVFNADTQTVNDADGYVINSDSDVAEAYLQINSNYDYVHLLPVHPSFPVQHLQFSKLLHQLK